MLKIRLDAMRTFGDGQAAALIQIKRLRASTRGRLLPSILYRNPLSGIARLKLASWIVADQQMPPYADIEIEAENEARRWHTGPRDAIASHALNTDERRLRRALVLIPERGTQGAWMRSGSAASAG